MDELRAFRERLGISREQMASDMALDQATIWKWEEGRHTPGGKNFLKLQRWLVDRAVERGIPLNEVPSVAALVEGAESAAAGGVRG